MSKILVERELLEAIINNDSEFYNKWSAKEELRAILAQDAPISEPELILPEVKTSFGTSQEYINGARAYRDLVAHLNGGQKG